MNQNWFFSKISKIDKFLAEVIKTKKSNKLPIERGTVTSDPTDIKRIKEYYEQHYANKFVNMLKEYTS